MAPASATNENVQRLLRAAQIHIQQDRAVEAARCFLEVTRCQPDCFEAFAQLGVILNQLNSPHEALACLETALRLRPNHPHLNMILGAVLKKLNRLQEAEACCRREVQIAPLDADAHYNLGLTLQAREDLEAALDAYGRALALRPGYLDALINRGVAYRELLRMKPALECFEAALRLAPDNAEAHWERCTALISLGELEQGWKEYEWRWKLKDFTTPPPQYGCPQWDGSLLHGQRILLHAEQGYGDIIQFVRYAPLVARKGGTVIVGCPAPLRSLLEGVEGVRQVVTSRSGLPAINLHLPLMSLPAIFGTSLNTIPAAVPYLTPPPGEFRLEPGTLPGLRVGLAWAGDPAHRNNHNRSLSLNRLQPLLRVPGIQWFSLQVGNQAAELSRLNLGERVTELGSRFGDFGDTARAISQLDLVITVDTAVAHLAGALGKEVWVLLPYAAEWRWMLDRLDSPWYPTMRLFRQSSRGDWDALVLLVTHELGQTRAHIKVQAAQRASALALGRLPAPRCIPAYAGSLPVAPP